MKYVAHFGEYSDRHIVGIFDSEEDAIAFCENANRNGATGYTCSITAVDPARPCAFDAEGFWQYLPARYGECIRSGDIGEADPSARIEWDEWHDDDNYRRAKGTP